MSKPIDRDISCRRCRYNLRGLQIEGQCPECGEEIDLSVDAFLAQLERQALPISAVPLDVRRKWLCGVYCLQASAAIAVVTGLVWGAIGTYDLTTEKLRDSAVLQMVVVISTLLAVVGHWMLATPDREEWHRLSSLGYRITMASFACFVVVQCVVSTSGEDSGMSRLIVAFALGAALAPVFAFAWLIHLCERIGKRSLAVMSAIPALAQSACMAASGLSYVRDGTMLFPDLIDPMPITGGVVTQVIGLSILLFEPERAVIKLLAVMVLLLSCCLPIWLITVIGRECRADDLRT